jgi:hypothetical protein
VVSGRHSVGKSFGETRHAFTASSVTVEVVSTSHFVRLTASCMFCQRILESAALRVSYLTHTSKRRLAVVVVVALLSESISIASHACHPR